MCEVNAQLPNSFDRAVPIVTGARIVNVNDTLAIVVSAVLPC